MKGDHNITVRETIRFNHPHFVRNEVKLSSKTTGTANFDTTTGFYLCWFPSLKTATHNWPVALTINEIEIVK